MGESPKEMDEFLTIDDVLLVPAFSEVLSKEVDVSTPLIRRIQWTIPLAGVVMDTMRDKDPVL